MSEHAQALPFNHLNELPSLVICKLDNWSLLSIKGEERKTYLNGQLTINCTQLQTGDSSLVAHCDAKGKMLAALRLFNLEDEIILAQKQSTLEQQMAALKKFAVFSKVDIQISEEWKLYAVAGQEAQAWIEARQQNNQETEIIEKIDLPSPRYLILSQQDIESPASENIWQALDIASGIAQLEQATQLQFIPQMLNLQLLNAISFSKGCYIGQETIARAKYRGTNKRATFMLQGSASATPQAGDILEQQLENGNWRKAGTVLQAVQYQDQHIELLAVMNKDIESHCQLRLKDDTSSQLQLGQQAYSLDEE